MRECWLPESLVYQGLQTFFPAVCKNAQGTFARRCKKIQSAKLRLPLLRFKVFRYRKSILHCCRRRNLWLKIKVRVNICCSSDVAVSEPFLYGFHLLIVLRPLLKLLSGNNIVFSAVRQTVSMGMAEWYCKKYCPSNLRLKSNYPFIVCKA